MAAPKRTWLWVVLGVFGTIGLVLILFIGGAIYEFRTHVRTESVETATAEQEFNRQRERFKGQQPLIEFVGNDRGDDDATVHRPPPTAPRARISTMRVLIYNLADGHLIHVEIPGWMLRMMPNTGRYGGGSGFSFDGDEQFARHRITLEDIERHGLGLVLEGHNRNTRILIWSE